MSTVRQRVEVKGQPPPRCLKKVIGGAGPRVWGNEKRVLAKSTMSSKGRIRVLERLPFQIIEMTISLTDAGSAAAARARPTACLHLSPIEDGDPSAEDEAKAVEVMVRGRGGGG